MKVEPYVIVDEGHCALGEAELLDDGVLGPAATAAFGDLLPFTLSGLLGPAART